MNLIPGQNIMRQKVLPGCSIPPSTQFFLPRHWMIFQEYLAL